MTIYYVNEHKNPHSGTVNYATIIGSEFTAECYREFKRDKFGKPIPLSTQIGIVAVAKYLKAKGVKKVIDNVPQAWGTGATIVFFRSLPEEENPEALINQLNLYLENTSGGSAEISKSA